MAEAEHSGVPHWAADRTSSLLCLLKIKLFFFFNQYFTSASRDTREVNCLPANGWRWRWDSDFQNKHGEWSLANKSLHTRTHTRAREPWSTARGMFWLAERGLRWPPKTPLMLREKVVKSTEVCFIYGLILYIVFTVKENTSGCDMLPVDVLSLQSHH